MSERPEPDHDHGDGPHSHMHAHADGILHRHEHGHVDHDHRHDHGEAEPHEHGDGVLHTHDPEGDGEADPRLVPRPRGTTTGATRSMRLPIALDEWLEVAHAGASAPLGERPARRTGPRRLALRDGYMSIHRYALEARVGHARRPTPSIAPASSDTFGSEYVEHLERWLEADGVDGYGTGVTATSSSSYRRSL
jgi:hypothetical protein